MEGNHATTRSVTPEAELKLQLTCADLLSACEDLAAQRQHGQPEVLHRAGCEDPGALLLAVCDLVQPSDLPGGWGPLWGAAVRLWRSGSNAQLEQAIGGTTLDVRTGVEAAVRFTRAHGMGVSQQAPVAAKRLLAFKGASQDYEASRKAAADALEARGSAFDGVV